jgi:hypothetical protein
MQYILANLGISPNFGTPDFVNLKFPTTMRIDYVRVYQPSDAINVGCNPADFPTQKYIDQYVNSLHRLVKMLIVREDTSGRTQTRT